MILVNRQLRVGLFRLGDLQKKLQDSRQLLIPLKEERKKLEIKINGKEKELKQLEKSIIALRSGDVVIRSGQSLFVSEINFINEKNIKSQIDNVLINANRYALKIVKPESKEIRNLLLLRKNHIEELQKTISKGGNWVINIKSVRNVLSGENFVYAFPEITENKIIVKKGVITKITFDQKDQKKGFGMRLPFIILKPISNEKKRFYIANKLK